MCRIINNRRVFFMQSLTTSRSRLSAFSREFHRPAEVMASYHHRRLYAAPDKYFLPQADAEYDEEFTAAFHIFSPKDARPLSASASPRPNGLAQIERSASVQVLTVFQFTVRTAQNIATSGCSPIVAHCRRNSSDMD